MSYQERIAVDTLLYKEVSNSSSEGQRDEKIRDIHPSPSPMNESMNEKHRDKWRPFSGQHCPFKFPIQSLRDSPNDTPQEKRKKFGKRLAFWAALSSGGSS